MIMKKLQWNSFSKKIYIHTTVERLYDLWATAAGISSWFLQSAEYKTQTGLIRNATTPIQKGDSYTWRWHNWEGKEEGTVLEANGKNYLEISFESSKVSIELQPKNNATLVILTQFGIPINDESKLKIYFGCSNGWTFWLTNLKAFVEHGILLNETKINLQENELAGYEFVNL